MLMRLLFGPSETYFVGILEMPSESSARLAYQSASSQQACQRFLENICLYCQIPVIKLADI